ncbi:hypothetical protein F5I97DRAFT_525194 [Phlebopus sp. FC_14]|nr:hypothetical protein F5I97DRAFT_525194 [Phlebopus sp. FC_14]
MLKDHQSAQCANSVVQSHLQLLSSDQLQLSQPKSQSYPLYATRCCVELPVELWLVVFEFSFALSRRQSYQDQSWTTEDQMSFPFALASVCSTWRSALASVPKYWTHLVFSINSPPTPLHHVKCFLAWSRPLPIHVLIARRPSTYEDCGCNEQETVKKIMQEVMSHISRCRSIRIDVRYSSSLPFLRVDFQGRAGPQLQALKLSCRLDDGGSSARSPFYSKLFAPHLRELHLDGRSFQGLCLSPSKWLSGLLGLKVLSVSCFHRNSWSDGLDLYGLLGAIESCSKLDDLTLRDLYFRRNRPWTLESFISNLRFMHLEDLDGDVLVEIIKAADIMPERVTISRCSLPQGCPPLMSDHVRFQTIDVSQNLMHPLSEWVGDALSVSHCPSFNDEFLEQLADGGPADARFPCPQLGQIRLNGCQNFSPQMLRNMIQKRCSVAWEGFSGDAAAVADHNFDTVAPITSVSVEGGPALTPTDRAWLQGNLASFNWSTKPSTIDSGNDASAGPL